MKHSLYLTPRQESKRYLLKTITHTFKSWNLFLKIVFCDISHNYFNVNSNNTLRVRPISELDMMCFNQWVLWSKKYIFPSLYSNPSSGSVQCGTGRAFIEWLYWMTIFPYVFFSQPQDVRFVTCLTSRQCSANLETPETPIAFKASVQQLRGEWIMQWCNTSSFLLPILVIFSSFLFVLTSGNRSVWFLFYECTKPKCAWVISFHPSSFFKLTVGYRSVIFHTYFGANHD